MGGLSVPLLLAAAVGVGLAHAVLPDHWLPLAVVARTSGWSLARTAKVSLLASIGHIAVSLVLGVAVAALGLVVRGAVVRAEGQIVGGLLVATGLGFLIWARTRGGHTHAHSPADDHAHPHPHPHGPSHHTDTGEPGPRPGPGDPLWPGGWPGQALASQHSRSGSWVGELAVPFGVAASPDLTILPVFLAASAMGVGVAVASLLAFALATMLTFVGLTVLAAAGSYQVHWPWLEANGQTISALVLLVVGALVFAGL